jgi:hypothetical protein
MPEPFGRSVQRLQSEAELTDVYVSEHLGIPRQLYALKKSGDRTFNDREVLALFALMPALLIAVAHANGFRAVPMTERGQRADVVHAATGALRAVSECSAAAMDALADGRIDRMEAHQLGERIGDGRKALAHLEASVDAARVA